MIWDEEFDVVVAGSGAAGCCAAIAAGLGGAGRILVAEKDESILGGTTRSSFGGWVWFPNNPFLRELGVGEPVEDVVKLMTEWARTSNATPDGKPASEEDLDQGDLDLIRAFAEESEGVITTLRNHKFYNCEPTEVKDEEDWVKNEALLRKKLATNPAGTQRAGLTEKQVEKMREWIPSYCSEHELDAVPTGKVLRPMEGGPTSQQLINAAKSFNGCEVRKGCTIIDLIRDEAGAVIGVKTADDGGEGEEVKNIRARGGVVFATGGYSCDQDMLDQHFGEGAIWGSCAFWCCTGDFIKIAERHNIPVPRPGRAWVKQTVLPFDQSLFGGVFFINVDSGFIVDASGKRFANEKHHYQDRAMDMLHHPERKIVFFVFDERARRKYNGPIKGLGGPIPMDEDLEEDCLCSGADEQAVAEKVAAMVSKIDVPGGFAFDAAAFAQGLRETLPRFNGFAKSGKDEDFQRGDLAGQSAWHLVGRAKDSDPAEFPNKTMYPLRWGEGVGDLHCLVLGVSTLDTKGGPRIDKKARVIGADGQPIQGLYGAGNCIRSGSNNSYWSAGCTISNAMVFGYIAGRDAAERLAVVKQQPDAQAAVAAPRGSGVPVPAPTASKL